MYERDFISYLLIKMLSIFILLGTTTVNEAEKMKSWPETLVFIFYWKTQPKSYENPDCLGTLLSPRS